MSDKEDKSSSVHISEDSPLTHEIGFFSNCRIGTAEERDQMNRAAREAREECEELDRLMPSIRFFNF